MGKLILKVRLGQVHSSLGRRLDAGQAVRCRAGSWMQGSRSDYYHIVEFNMKVRLG